MKKRYHRWGLVLGLFAMLGAVLAAPMTSIYALAMNTKALPAATDTMPCHKSQSPCPDCPQKVCPSMGTCLVKCFQSLYQPVSSGQFVSRATNGRMRPAPPQVVGDTLIPPLLRPPSA